MTIEEYVDSIAAYLNSAEGRMSWFLETSSEALWQRITRNVISEYCNTTFAGAHIPNTWSLSVVCNHTNNKENVMPINVDVYQFQVEPELANRFKIVIDGVTATVVKENHP